MTGRTMVEYGMSRSVDSLRPPDGDPAHRGPYLDATWLRAEELGDHEVQERLCPHVPRSVVHLVARHLDSEQVAAFYARTHGVRRPWVLNVLTRTGDERILRVRMHPQVHEHLTLAAEAYAAALAIERRARDQAEDTPATVLATGVQGLENHVMRRGHESFGGWMSTLALQKLAARMDSPLLQTARAMVATRRQVDRVRMSVVAAYVAGEALGRETLTRIGAFRGQVDSELAGLCRATEEAVSEMAVEAANLAEALPPLGHRCAEAVVCLLEFHRWVSRYRLMVSRLPDAANLTDLTEALDRYLAAGEGGPLENVADACRTLRVGYDVESLVGHLHDIRGAAAHISTVNDLPGHGLLG